MKRFLMLLMTGILATFPLTAHAGNPPFEDMETYAEDFFEAVYQLSLIDVVRGDDGSNNVRGEDPINRAELVTLLLRMNGYGDEEALNECLNPDVELTPFSDVEQGAWYEHNIDCAVILGWVQGDDNADTFRPGDSVNVVESAKMITKAFGIEATDMGIEGDFVNWYTPYLAILTQKGILHPGNNLELTNWYADDLVLTYNQVDLGEPGDFMTRGMIFDIIDRLRTLEFNSLSENPSYDVFWSPSEYELLYDPTLTEMSDSFSITDSHFGFSLMDIPLGEFSLKDLRFYIENPSGFQNGYLTSWHVMYPLRYENGNTQIACNAGWCTWDISQVEDDTRYQCEASNGPNEEMNCYGDKLFSIEIYDKTNYTEADIYTALGDEYAYIINCSRNDNGPVHSELADLYTDVYNQVCPSSGNEIPFEVF